ncbi:FAD-dependent oxidoreductase [Salinibacterium sp. ZJ77]|uniref:FAD-dependent oxidoreductase n=1 Tax=Salinibacterium sp. ZJ77 TaxID=2708337 RepID=UPI001FBA326E|nr:FAD-dependent oxidoreductase [Salinibacterium sp. ZJ77]
MSPSTSPSLWMRTAPPIVVPDEPPPGYADVVIAGAGLTGLSLARMLAHAGAHVVVIEARTVGAVATGNTTGKLSLVQGSVYSEMRSATDDDTVRAYADAQRAAQDWLLAVTGDAPGCAHEAVSTAYSLTDHGMETLEEEFAALALAGIVPRVAQTGERIEGLPFPVRSALLLDGQAQLQPMRVLGELTRQATVAGARIIERCRVTGAEVDGNVVRIETTRGSVVADRLVLATGYPILDRGFYFAKLKPSRSFVGAYRVPDETALPTGMHLGVDSAGYSLRVDPGPDGTPLLVVGGGAHVTGREERTSRLVAEMDAWTAEQWPGARRELLWAAQDYRTPDTVPFAGELPRGGDRIFAATGFNKWGMTNAVASALRICGELLGSTPAWSEVLARGARGWTAAWNLVRDGTEVASELASGWVQAELASSDGVPAEGEGRVLSRGLRPIVESTVDGVTCRLSGVCTHMGGVLGWNDVERTWDCPLHGSRFSSEGTVLEGPAVRDLEPIETEPHHESKETP